MILMTIVLYYCSYVKLKYRKENGFEEHKY